MGVISPRWSVWPDQRITRRKYFHLVVNPQGRTEFRSRLIAECLDYLAALGVDEFELRCPESAPVICAVQASGLKE